MKVNQAQAWNAFLGENRGPKIAQIKPKSA